LARTTRPIAHRLLPRFYRMRAPIKRHFAQGVVNKKDLRWRSGIYVARPFSAAFRNTRRFRQWQKKVGTD